MSRRLVAALIGLAVPLLGATVTVPAADEGPTVTTEELEAMVAPVAAAEDLGEKTTETAKAMTADDLDDTWQPAR